MGISGSYGSDLPEVTSILPGAQIIGTKDDILFRADPSLLGGTVVEDNLTSDSTTNALSAKQGKVLKDTIDGLGSGVIVVDNLTTQSTADALSANQGYVLSQNIANTLTNASTRYSVNAQTETTYTVVVGDVTSTGRVIVKCTNAAAITVTIPTPTTLGVTTGDSVNIRQGGAGIVTISGTLEGNGVFTAQHETKTLIAQAANTWLVVGG